MKEAELGNIRQWLLDAEQMIREKGATKELGRDEQNRLLTYLYLHYYKAADFAVSEISVRKVHNEWTERRNVLLGSDRTPENHNGSVPCNGNAGFAPLSADGHIHAGPAGI